jgi:glycopeptide antibiotics resistance protein
LSPPSDATGRRLGALFLGYLAVVVAVITLAPFQFAVPARFTAALVVTDGGWATDVILNIVLFVPLGVLWHRTRGGTMLAGLGFGLLLGACIEAAQLFLAPRYTTLSDILANGTGSWLGATISVVLSRRVASTTLVTRLWLDQPMMGLVYLLWPLAWLVGLSSGSAPDRLWLLVPIGAAGALAITAVATVGRSRRQATLLPIAMSTVWMTVAAVPAMRVAPRLAGIGIATVFVVATFGGPLWRFALRRERRLEPQVVRAILPLLAVLLIGVSRHAGSVAVTGGGEAARESLLRVIAQAATFTLLGYLVAESRGRREEPLRRLLTWPMAVATMTILLIAILHTDSMPPMRVAAVLVAAAIGATLYDAQRAHVLALLGPR